MRNRILRQMHGKENPGRDFPEPSFSLTRVLVSYLLIFCLTSQNILWATSFHILPEDLREPRIRTYTTTFLEKEAQVSIIEPHISQEENHPFEGDVHNFFADLKVFHGSGGIFLSPEGTKTLYNRVHSKDPVYWGGTLESTRPVSMVMSNKGGVLFDHAQCLGPSHLSLLGGEVVKTPQGMACSITQGSVSLTENHMGEEEGLQSLSLMGRGVHVVNSILTPPDGIDIRVGSSVRFVETGESCFATKDESTTENAESGHPLGAGFLLDESSILRSKGISIESVEQGFPLIIRGMLQATERDIFIRAAGDIYLDHVTSIGQLFIQTSGKVHLNGQVMSGGGMEVQAQKGIFIGQTGKILSNGNLTFKGRTVNKGHLETLGKLDTEGNFENTSGASLSFESVSNPFNLLKHNLGSIDVKESLSFNISQNLTLRGTLNIHKDLKVTGKKNLTLRGSLNVEGGCTFGEKPLNLFMNEGSFSVLGPQGLRGKIKKLENKGQIDLSNAHVHIESLNNGGNGSLQGSQGVFLTRGHFFHEGNAVENNGTFLTLGIHQNVLTGSYTDSGRLCTPTLWLIRALNITLLSGRGYSKWPASYYVARGLFDCHEFEAPNGGVLYEAVRKGNAFFHVNAKGKIHYKGSLKQSTYMGDNGKKYLNIFRSLTGSSIDQKVLNKTINSYEKQISGVEQKSQLSLQSKGDIHLEKTEITLDSGDVHVCGKNVRLNGTTASPGIFRNDVRIFGENLFLKKINIASLWGKSDVQAEDFLRLTKGQVFGKERAIVSARETRMQKGQVRSSHGPARVVGMDRLDVDHGHVEGDSDSGYEGKSVSLKNAKAKSKNGTAYARASQNATVTTSHFLGKKTELSATETLKSSKNTFFGAYHDFCAKDVYSKEDRVEEGSAAFKASEQLSLEDFYGTEHLTAHGPKITLLGKIEVGEALFHGDYLTHEAKVFTQGSSHLTATASYQDTPESLNHAGGSVSIKAPQSEGFLGQQKAGETVSVHMKNMRPDQNLPGFLEQIDAPVVMAELEEADVILNDDLTIHATLYLWAKRFENRARMMANQDFNLFFREKMFNEGVISIRGKGHMEGEDLSNKGTIEANSLGIHVRNFSMERPVIRSSHPHGYEEKLGEKASLEAHEGTLDVHARESFITKGGRFRAKGSVTLNSKGYLYLGPQVMKSETHWAHENTSYDRSTLRNEKTRVTSGGDIKVLSKTSMLLEGIDIQGERDLLLRTQGDLVIRAVYDLVEESYLRLSSGGFFEGEERYSKQLYSKGSLVNALKMGRDIVIQSDKGNGYLQNIHAKNKGNTSIRAPEGSLVFPVATSVYRTEEEESSENFFWQSQSIKGSHHTSSSHSQWENEGDLRFSASKGIEIEHAQDLNILEDQQGMAWIRALRADPQATFKRIHDIHEEWHHESQGLSGPAGAIICLAMALATQGMGASLLSIAPSNVTMTAMANAGFTTLASQASISLINNQGDLGKTFGDLVSSKNLLSLATSVLTAGITSKLSQTLKLPEAPKAISEHLKRNALHGAVSGGISMAIHGESFQDALSHFVSSTVANTLGAVAASEIGDTYGKHQIGYLTHKLAHGILGAAQSAITGKHPLEGAFAGIAAEMIGEAICGSAEARMENLVKEALDKGEVLDRDMLMKRFQDGMQNDVKLTRFITALGGAFAGFDVNRVDGIASNALNNNFLPLALLAGEAVLLAGLCVTTAVTYKLCYEASKGGGVQHVVNGFVANGTIQVETSQGAQRYVLEGQTYPDLKSLWQGMKEVMPGIRFLAESFMGSTYVDTGYDPATEGFQAHGEQGPKIHSTPQADPVPNVESYPAHEDNGPRIFSTPIEEKKIETPGFGEDTDLPDMSILEDKIHALYEKNHPDGRPSYVGRASGEGDVNDPESVRNIVRNRDRNHHKNAEGFGRAEPLHASENPDIIRGMEQQEIDRRGGAQKQGGTSSNVINSISEKNPKRQQYMDAAEQAKNNAPTGGE